MGAIFKLPVWSWVYLSFEGEGLGPFGRFWYPAKGGAPGCGFFFRLFPVPSFPPHQKPKLFRCLFDIVLFFLSSLFFFGVGIWIFNKKGCFYLKKKKAGFIKNFK